MKTHTHLTLIATALLFSTAGTLQAGPRSAYDVEEEEAAELQDERLCDDQDAEFAGMLSRDEKTTASSVSTSKIYSGTGLAAGATKEIWWNNAAGSSVYAFTAQPNVLAGSSGCAEVTRVWSTLAGNPQEREVHMIVKNCGSISINYDIFMARMY